MDPALIAFAATAAIIMIWLVWQVLTSSRAVSGERSLTSRRANDHLDFPAAGLLVPEDVLQSSNMLHSAIWDALETAAVPVAVEYYPVSQAEMAKLRTVPVNATAQQAMVEIVKAVNPKGPTLYRAVLPKGAELVKAVGQSGFRGFSRTGNKTAHAVLKPVAAGGAVAAGWPLFAVAGTVLAVDMVSERQQLAHQRRVESILGRQEERHYVERIKDQRSADGQLSRAISLMLDGHDPHLELALKSADDEFHRSKQFLDKFRGVLHGLVDEVGKVDYHQLRAELGGDLKDVDYFVRELHLARAAIAIKRKALVADAASVALADPTNPYLAMQRFLDAELHDLEDAEALAAELTEQLTSVELKGRWHDRDKSVARRQAEFRGQIAPPSLDDSPEILYLSTGTGDILQVLPSSDDKVPQPPLGPDDNDAQP